MTEQQGWIPDIELEDADIKWAWSNFDGRKGTFNEEGEHFFQVRIPTEMVDELREQGWTIKEQEGYEEGDPSEFLLKVNISYRFEPPKIFFIKGDRKFRVENEKELADIKRATTEQLDVIIQPSRWVKSGRTGVSGYVKEMYVKIKESRFSAAYSDYEEV